MLQMDDPTKPIDERKTVRKELKQKPSVAQAIKQAAALAGMDESTFINSAAYQKAREFLDAQYQTVLENSVFEQFANVVDGIDGQAGKRIEPLSEAIAQGRERFID